MSDPRLIRSRGPSGKVGAAAGMPLVDDYLEFLDVAVGGHAAMVQPVDPAQEPAGVTTSPAARRLPRILATTEVDQLTAALHA